MDASQAGEGQLEISINDGEVPNEVQVLGGGKCIVTFTPELMDPHNIDIHFNGESVPGMYRFQAKKKALTIFLWILVSRNAYTTLGLPVIFLILFKEDFDEQTIFSLKIIKLNAFSGTDTFVFLLSVCLSVCRLRFT